MALKLRLFLVLALILAVVSLPIVHVLAQSAGVTTVTVSFSATPTFTCNAGVTNFVITLTGNVTGSSIACAAVSQGSVKICQDGVGNRSFVFPSNANGYGTIDPTPSKCSSQSFSYDGTNMNFIGIMNTTNSATPAGGGSGTTSFSAGNFSPLFNTSVATPTTTPSLTFSPLNAAQNSVYAGPASGGAGIPSFQTGPTISAANMTNFPTFNQSTTGNAATATALAATPSQCGSGNVATGITANGTANCTAGIAGPTGAQGSGYAATSTTSLTLATGTQTLTTQSGLAYSAGARVRFTYTGNTGDYMEGLAISYSGTTLSINVDTVNGSGTFASWNINIAGNVGSLSATGQDIWFIQNACQGLNSGTAVNLPAVNAATPYCATGTTNQIFATLHFAPSVTQYAQFSHVLPTNWNGTIDFIYKWRTIDSNTGHNSVLNIQGVCIPASGSTGDPAFGTANVSTVAANGTTLQQVVTTVSALANLTSCSGLSGSGNILSFQLSQTGTLVNDMEIVSAFFRPSCGTALCTY